MILVDGRSTEGNAEVRSLVFLDYCLNNAVDGNILDLIFPFPISNFWPDLSVFIANMVATYLL